MSSPDDLLRERLARLAPSAPADSMAFEGIERRITHRRRRRAAARVAAVAAVALVAVGVGTLATGRDQRSDVSTQPAETTTSEPDASAAAPTVGQTGRVTFGGASFEVPEGWEVTSYDDGVAEDVTMGPDRGYESLCIGAPGDEQDSCGAIAMYHGDTLPGGEGQPYQDHGAWSWHQGNDVALCPLTPSGGVDYVQPAGGDYAPIRSDAAAPVGDRTAVYDEWAAVCDSGPTFNPRAWHLSDEQFLIVDVIGHPQTDDVLASFRFDDAG
jgi:hypothetical protein